MQKSKKTDALSNSADFPIVGIGASAGGLEALEQFFANVPINCGIAFVVIQHLAPNHTGMMPELLQRITPLKVMQATDKLKVKVNCVYVIPPNKSMSIVKGFLHLSDSIEINGLRLPIDIFFRSLADDKSEKSIAIVLSGMGSDGSLGMKAIKEKNGAVLVQDPASAKFDSMPKSALEVVIADIVAPADELAGKLLAFLKFVPAVPAEIVKTDSKSKSNIDKIIILLREQTGHDFSMYKKNTLLRRIERRKSLNQISNINTYINFLHENPKEIEILFKELLIGVTSFFRDKLLWENLKDKILPDLLEKLPDGYILRAWVPACSTGEEAYSLAMIFKETLEKTVINKNISLQIFASDLDKEAIQLARKGVFAASIVSDVSPERLSRFFSIESKGYRVNTGIREMIVFAPQDVIKDPPFTRLDLLTCRNMLIYLEPELQKKVMSLFHYSLNTGGIMILGSAETTGNYGEGFEEIDAKLKIYKSVAATSSSDLINFPNSYHGVIKAAVKNKIIPQVVENIQTLADQVLLQRFAPASVLVNNKGDIVYITGRTGKYLEPLPGKANWNIYAMAREGLRLELPSAFRKAMQNFDPVKIKNIKVGTNGGTQYIDVTVQRLDSPEAIKGMIMVVFTDVSAIIEHDPAKPKTVKHSSSRRHKELELELQRSHEDLQSVREEMQTSQEELKSTNEELQSTNEELQSSNEELSTSKEEMQSLNEELQTVNIELQSKVSDYILASNDMKNLLNSTEIATLFLDKELNIRRFTDNVIDIFKLRTTDIGRLFTDQVSDLEYPEIANHAKQVMKTLISIETAISTRDGRWFKVRIMPYRTHDDRVDGLVITFSDITIAKKLEIELKRANQVLKGN